MKKKYLLTKKGLEKLKKELKYLKKVKRKEIAERLKQTASFGDLSENAAYQEAKEAQAFIEGKILELEKIIALAEIIKPKRNGKIEIGSKVSLKLLESGEEFNFQIVGEAEADPLSGKISYKSPLGKKLLGKREGDLVKIETELGKKEYKILKIA